MVDPTPGPGMLEYERQPDSTASLFEPHRAVVRLRGAQPNRAEDDPFGSLSVGIRTAEVMSRSEIHVVPGGYAPWSGEPDRIRATVRPFLARHTKGARV
jgi:hypothetical protein